MFFEKVTQDGGGASGLVAEEDFAGEVDTGLGDLLGDGVGVTEVFNGELEGSFVWLVGDAVGVVFAGDGEREEGAAIDLVHLLSRVILFVLPDGPAARGTVTP